MEKIKIFVKEYKIILLILLLVFIVAGGIYYYTNKKRNVPYSKGEDSDVTYVEKSYAINEYSTVTIELTDLLNEYFSYYIRLQVKNPELAFDLLTSEQQAKFNNDLTTYKDYLKKVNTVNTLNSKIKEYRVDKYDEHKISIIDTEDNCYTIIESAVWDFKISLDGKR